MRSATVSPRSRLSLENAAGAADVYAGLVQRAAAGDHEALEELLMKAQDVAYRFSVVACGHVDEAEDVMQEALIKTFRYVGRIKQPEFFRTWLYRTVRNACISRHRRRVDEPAHLQSIDDLLPDSDNASQGGVPMHPGPDPEEVLGNTRLRQQLHHALASLPAEFRQVVFLRDIEGLSTREAADVIGVSEPNVKSRLHRARLVLRQALQQESNATPS